MQKLPTFTQEQILTVGDATAMAEELVSNAYKMSASQWLRNRYGVETLAGLTENEIVEGPFAQIIRYKVKRTESSLESASYDFYKICLQDHSILKTLKPRPELRLFPFALYVLCHELIHIVRFAKFLQAYEASPEERMQEENRVHQKTRELLNTVRVPGMEKLFDFYKAWHTPVETSTVLDPHDIWD